LVARRGSGYMLRMANRPEFKFSRYPEPWLGGEPRVFAVDAEDDFPNGYDLQGVRLLTVEYKDGGFNVLSDHIAEAARIPTGTSFQALLENLSELSDREPVIVYIRHSDRLLADIGPALIHVLTSWEGYVRHAAGVHPMYLVMETGPRATVSAAFHPGGKVDWL
jgi:hypothetical protein